MNILLLASIALIIGLAILVWSSDRFVKGAAGIAVSLGMSKLMVGLTIVALGTSAPEILVSLMSALNDKAGLAIGNAIGSNIANIGLVLGATCLITPLTVHASSMRQDLPTYALVCLATLAVMYNLSLSITDSAILLVLLAAIMFALVKYRSSHTEDDLAQEFEESDIDEDPKTAIFDFVLGLVLLVASSRLLVWAASELASHFGVSDTLIGLTIVAIGTSLPELAASVQSALQKHHDLAIGNVIGSNVLNLLAVLPMAALGGTVYFSEEFLYRDLGVMLGLSVFMLAAIFLPKKGSLSRLSGVALLASYIFYISFIALSQLS